MRAQIIRDVQEGFHHEAGPWASERIGVAFGEMVFWVGSRTCPGVTDVAFAPTIAFAEELVRRWNAGEADLAKPEVASDVG